MMMRTICPRCLAGLEVDRVYADREVMCEGCGRIFVAKPAGAIRRRTWSDEDRDDRPRRRRRRPADDSSWAIASFLLGITSAVIFCLWPLGLMAALAGLITGSRGLESRSRRLAVVGLVFSIVGMTFAAGVGVTMVVAIVAAAREDANGPRPR